jgi:hypothetical protein
MANKNLLTYAAKVSSVEQATYAPVTTIGSTDGSPIETLYAFLAKVDPWPNENDPITPTQDQATLKKIFKNIFVAKQIHSSDISPVIERKDWTTGTVYDYYKDTVDMFEQDPVTGKQILNYYVKNRYDQVFKCLWNNNGGESTIEPYFEPGSYNTDNLFISASVANGGDAYKWKYVYTIDTGSKVKFMDRNWIPVVIGPYLPSPSFTAAGAGSLDVINVIDGGSGYDQANADVNVVITGDGYGAIGSAVVVDGIVTDVRMINSGTNYTVAGAEIVSSIGSGAALEPSISPIGGHGFDPVAEFGCHHVMFTTEFNSDEGGVIPTDIDFHQVGLLISPSTANTPLTGAAASGEIYKTTTDFVVASGFGSYTNDEMIYQGATIETASFVGTVLSFDQASNVIRVLNTTGTPSNNSPVFGNTTRTTRTLLSYSLPVFTTFSGYLSFIENRTGIQRSPDGIEQIKIVLGY